MKIQRKRFVASNARRTGDARHRYRFDWVGGQWRRVVYDRKLGNYRPATLPEIVRNGWGFVR